MNKNNLHIGLCFIVFFIANYHHGLFASQDTCSIGEYRVNLVQEPMYTQGNQNTIYWIPSDSIIDLGKEYILEDSCYLRIGISLTENSQDIVDSVLVEFKEQNKLLDLTNYLTNGYSPKIYYFARLLASPKKRISSPFYSPWSTDTVFSIQDSYFDYGHIDSLIAGSVNPDRIIGPNGWLNSSHVQNTDSVSVYSSLIDSSGIGSCKIRLFVFNNKIIDSLSIESIVQNYKQLKLSFPIKEGLNKYVLSACDLAYDPCLPQFPSCTIPDEFQKSPNYQDGIDTSYLKIDITKPVINIQNTYNDSLISGDTLYVNQLLIQVHDNLSLINTCEYKILKNDTIIEQGEITEPAIDQSITFGDSDLRNGAYILTVTASDSAGNETTKPISFIYWAQTATLDKFDFMDANIRNSDKAFAGYTNEEHLTVEIEWLENGRLPDSLYILENDEILARYDSLAIRNPMEKNIKLKHTHPDSMSTHVLSLKYSLSDTAISHFRIIYDPLPPVIETAFVNCGEKTESGYRKVYENQALIFVTASDSSGLASYTLNSELKDPAHSVMNENIVFENLSPGLNTWDLSVTDSAGNTTTFTDPGDNIYYEDGSHQMPLKCYPNPFHIPSDGTMKIELESSSDSEVKIYDCFGYHIKTIQVGETAGNTCIFLWDGKNENNKYVASGGYFCIAKNAKQTFKIAIIRE